MDGQGGYVGLRRQERAAAGAGVGLVAAALALAYLLLGSAFVPPRPPAGASLTTFDVPPPPPPPVTPPPELPRDLAAAARPAPSSAGGGGSPGRSRERPAEVAIDPAPPVVAAPPSPLVQADAPPPSAGRSSGSAAGGQGIGMGEGEGRGAGRGSGAGDGTGGFDAVRYARTEWISPPTAPDFQRGWPPGEEKLTAPVAVVLACDVLRTGYLRRCTILREERPGYGAAAIRIIHYSRAKPVRRNGRNVNIPVLVPLVFQPTPPVTPGSRPRSAP